MLGGFKIVTVRCEGGAVVTRVRTPVEADESGDEAYPLTEHMCHKCRNVMLRTVFHDLERSELLVLHWVDPAKASVVETRVIIRPRSDDWGLNRGGRLVPAERYKAALAASDI